MPISVPAGVDVKIEDGNFVTDNAPTGTLAQQLTLSSCCFPACSVLPWLTG